jgi:hypothetical protein
LNRAAFFLRRNVLWLFAVAFVVALWGWACSRRSVDVGTLPPTLGELHVRLSGQVPTLGATAHAFVALPSGKFGEAKQCELVHSSAPARPGQSAQPSVPVPPSQPLQSRELLCRLAPGRYWILGRVPGSARFSTRAEVLGGTTTVEVTLEKAHNLKVDVRFRDERGDLHPLAEATVLIRPSRISTAKGEAGESITSSSGALGAESEVPFGALTSHEGLATFSDLPVPPYRVEVFARGYEPYEAEIQSDPLIVLRPVRGLFVRVQSEGRPAPGAEVHIAGISLWPPRQIRTTESGTAQVYGLSQGRYAVTAELGSRVSRAPVFVDLGLGQGLEEATIELHSGEELSVRVREKGTGASISGAHVSYAPNSSFERVRTSPANAEGLAKFVPLPHVSGTVHASARGYVAKTLTVDQAGVTDIELEKGGTITGVVRNERGEPISFASVKILGHDEQGQPIVFEPRGICTQDAYFAWLGDAPSRVIPAGELGVMLGPVPPIPLYMRASGPCPTAPSDQGDLLLTGADGRFAAHGVAPGTVLVLAEHPDYQSAKSPAGRLVSAGSLSLDVTLITGEPFLGRLLDHRDFPVSGALVRILGREFERDVRTETDGTFRVAAAPVALTVRVVGTPGGAGAMVLERVEGPKRHEELILHLPAPREAVRVSVLDGEGRPIDFAEVRLRAAGPEPYRETRFTNAVGEAEFAGARGRIVQARIEASGQAVLEVQRELGEKEVFRLTPAVRATGRITAVRGRWPAVSAQVRLSCGEQSYQTHTGETGEYEFVGVPEGSCKLRAHHDEHGVGVVDVRIEAEARGRPFVLPDVDLSPPVQVRGIVRDEKGEKVPFAIVSTTPLPAYVPMDTRVYPEPWTTANPEGEFAFAAFFDGPPRLYAVSPAQGTGEAPFGPGNIEEQNLEIRITRPDAAPPEALGSLMLGLRQDGQAVQIGCLIPDHPTTRKLRVGDEIVSIDRESPAQLSDARAWLSGAPGSEVELVLRRGSRTLTVVTEREAFRRGQ